MSPAKRTLLFSSFAALFVSGLLSLWYSATNRMNDAWMNLTIEEFDNCRSC